MGEFPGRIHFNITSTQLWRRRKQQEKAKNRETIKNCELKSLSWASCEHTKNNTVEKARETKQKNNKANVNHPREKKQEKKIIHDHRRWISLEANGRKSKMQKNASELCGLCWIFFNGSCGDESSLTWCTFVWPSGLVWANESVDLVYFESILRFRCHVSPIRISRILRSMCACDFHTNSREKKETRQNYTKIALRQFARKIIHSFIRWLMQVNWVLKQVRALALSVSLSLALLLLATFNILLQLLRCAMPSQMKKYHSSVVIRSRSLSPIFATKKQR